VSIESILRRKGTDVTTIAPENSSGSQHQESGGLAPRKEYWRSRGDEWERGSWSHFRT